MSRKIVKKILSSEAGATAVEYALIAALVFLASAGAITAMSSTFQTVFTDSFTSITSAMAE